MPAWDGGCAPARQARELLQLPVVSWLKPRLKTSIFVLFLIYGAYFALRSAVEVEEKKATLAAVYAPIGFLGGLTGKLFIEFAFTLAGVLMIIGLRRLAVSLMVFGVTLPMLPVFTPIIEEVLAALPPEAAWLVLAGMGLMLLFGALRLLFGRRVAERVLAQIIVMVVVFIFLVPLRGAVWLLRLMF